MPSVKVRENEPFDMQFAVLSGLVKKQEFFPKYAAVNFMKNQLLNANAKVLLL